MIRPLRTAHFFVWRVLAPTLSIAFVLALLFRPERNAEQRNTDSFKFSFLRQDSSIQINIEVLNPLATPSCLVYALQDEQQKIFLGKIGTRGTYVFNSSNRTKQILLVDGIHKKEIMTYLIPNGL